VLRQISFFAAFAYLMLSIVFVLTVAEERSDARSGWDAGEWRIVESAVAHPRVKIPVRHVVVHLPVTVTIYHPVEEQTDSTPHIVASGKHIDIPNARAHRYLAVSRDLHVRWGGPLSFGEIVRLEGAGDLSGYYIVEDTMNARFKNRVDILRSPGDPLAKFPEATLVMKTNEAPRLEDTPWTTN